MNRWTVIAGALIVQVILGTVYAFSVFVSPLEAEFGWERTTTQWAFSLALASFAAMMIPAGRLPDRIGPRRVASIGGILLGLSFLLGAALVNADRPWALYLTYGILGGAGIGFAYVCPIAAAVKWFPDKKVLITGLAVAGFGAGALFFAGPASMLLLPPAESGEALGISQILLVGLGIQEGGGFGIGWKAFFILHGVVCAGAVLLGVTLLRNPPAGYKPEGWNPPEAQGTSPTEVSWREMLDTPLACMLWLTFGGNFALFASSTADYFGTKNFGMNYGWIFTACGVAGILGPVVGGVLFDVTQRYILAFVFAGILCFVAVGCAVVVWGLERTRHAMPPQTVAATSL